MEEVEALLIQEKEAVEGNLAVEEVVVHLGGRVEDQVRIEGMVEGNDTTTTPKTNSTAISSLFIRKETMRH
jgi:hypothetical protein